MCVAEYIKWQIFDLQLNTTAKIQICHHVKSSFKHLTDFGWLFCLKTCSWSRDWFSSFTIQCDPLKLNAASRLNRWCSIDDTLRSSLSKKMITIIDTHTKTVFISTMWQIKNVRIPVSSVLLKYTCGQSEQWLQYGRTVLHASLRKQHDEDLN